jgi:hypothetical protein
MGEGGENGDGRKGGGRWGGEGKVRGEEQDVPQGREGLASSTGALSQLNIIVWVEKRAWYTLCTHALKICSNERIQYSSVLFVPRLLLV